MNESGQAAVEAALATPVSLFVVLGILQMGMMQQARFLADYAAYRGARAASTQRCECPFIEKAELAALVPTLGRADDLSHWKATYGNIRTNRASGVSLPITRTRWTLENVHRPFDDPKLRAGEAPETVHLRLRYYYRMNIPFANWLFAKFFVARHGLQTWASVDPLMTTRKVNITGTPPSDPDIAEDFATMKSYFDRKIYVAPIYSSWSMRMFSQADVSGSNTGRCD